MLEFIYFIVLFIFCLLSQSVTVADITCGSFLTDKTICYGAGAYCCGLYDDICCWESYNVASFWWFWFIWFFVFMLIVTCITCICRRRRARLAQSGYMVVQPRQYGAVVATGYPNPPSYQVTQTTTAYPASAPSAPAAPAYAPAYQQKPPPYSAA